MSKQKGKWLFSCLPRKDHSAEELIPALQLSFDSVTQKQSATPPLQIKSHFFTPSANVHGEVCPNLIEVEFAARVWSSDNRLQRQRAPQLRSAQSWSCQLTTWTMLHRDELTMLFQLHIHIPDSPQPDTAHPSAPALTLRSKRKSGCIISNWDVSVAASAAALWGHCVGLGLPASHPPKHTYIHTCRHCCHSHSLTNPSSQTFISARSAWIRSSSACHCAPALWKSHSSLPAEGPQLTSKPQRGFSGTASCLLAPCFQCKHSQGNSSHTLGPAHSEWQWKKKKKR